MHYMKEGLGSGKRLTSWNQPGAWTPPAESVGDAPPKPRTWRYWESPIPSPPNSLESSQPQMSFPGDTRGKEHGFLPARILEWLAIPFSKGIFLTPGGDPGLLHCRQSLYHWAEIVYIQSDHNHTHRNRLTQTHRYITHIYIHVCVVTDILRTPVIVLCCLYKFCTLYLTFHVATISEIGFTEVYLCIICTFVEVLIQWAVMYPQLLHELHSRDIEFWASMVAQG